MDLKKKIIFFLFEGALFWFFYFIWSYFEPAPWAKMLFFFNALFQIPIGFWMGDRSRAQVLANIEIKKDLRSEVKANRKYPIVTYLREKFLYFYQNVTASSISAAKLFFFIDLIKQDAKVQTEHSAEVNTSLKEMSDVIQDISESTESSLQQAQTSYQAAETGVQRIQENVTIMNELIDSNQRINQTMQELMQSTGKINQVMEVIQSISSQTNMLSLNAAIEAAKAGEYGKGFAVVAEEVRNLANRTDQSTNEISNLIQNIEGITSKVVLELQAGTEKINQGQAATLQSKEAFDDILSNTGQTQTQAQEIAAAVEQQFRSIESISTSMEDLSTSIGNIYQNIDDSAATARSLSTQGEDFMRFILDYRLGNRTSKLVSRLRRFKKDIEKLLSEAEKEQIPIWDRDYQEVADTIPLKHQVKYLDWLRKSKLQALQDQFQRDNAVIFTALVDNQGYLPLHNSKFDKPLTGNEDVDIKQSRSQRIFDDFTGLRAGQSQKPMLLQTYVRDTGEIMMDLSFPILVKKRHWGGIRVGFLPEGQD